MAKSTGSGVRKEMVTSKVKEKKNSLDSWEGENLWISKEVEESLDSGVRKELVTSKEKEKSTVSGVGKDLMRKELVTSKQSGTSKEKEKSRDSGVNDEKSADLGVSKELVGKKQEMGKDVEVGKNQEKEMGVRKKMTSESQNRDLEREEFVLNVEELGKKYPTSIEHVQIIKKFPRREWELFQELENRIPAAKNPEFLFQLFNGGDVETTVEAFLLTKESYEEKFGKQLEDIEVRPTMGATGGRGMDTAAKGSKMAKSAAWLSGLTWAYNMFSDFIKANPEFRCFDWTSATFEEVDVYLGYLWLWMGPQEGGGSLGVTRYTSDSLKQIKTKFQNLLVHMLKRKDINLSHTSMTFSNNMYLSKRNLTALEPMEGNAGDRKRVAIDQPDRDKMDQWMSPDLEQVITCKSQFNITLFNLH